jgi:hypothetical protein
MGSFFKHVRSFFGIEEDEEELRVHYGDIIIPLRVPCDSCDTIRHLPGLLAQRVDVVLPPRYDLSIDGKIVSDQWARMIRLQALIENKVEVRILTACCDGGTEAKSSSPLLHLPGTISASTSLMAVAGIKRTVRSVGLLPDGTSDSKLLNQKKKKKEQSTTRHDAKDARESKSSVAGTTRLPPSLTSEKVRIFIHWHCCRSVFA